MCCILSKFYIKPQLCCLYRYYRLSCILSKFYIKPQLVPYFCDIGLSCILSKFYIKPQLKVIHRLQPRVVSYRNSTSNHNVAEGGEYFRRLYLIEILHQTTTPDVMQIAPTKLYLIEILHQTTTTAVATTSDS